MILENYFELREVRRDNRTAKERFRGGNKPLTYYLLRGFPEPDLKEQDDEWHGLMDRAARILSARRDGSMARPELDSRKLGYK